MFIKRKNENHLYDRSATKPNINNMFTTITTTREGTNYNNHYKNQNLRLVCFYLRF